MVSEMQVRDPCPAKWWPRRVEAADVKVSWFGVEALVPVLFYRVRTSGSRLPR